MNGKITRGQLSPGFNSELDGINMQLNDIAVYSIKYFGAKCDGVTDDTQALINAGNYKDNIRVKFPSNTTTIII